MGPPWTNINVSDMNDLLADKKYFFIVTAESAFCTICQADLSHANITAPNSLLSHLRRVGKCSTIRHSGALGEGNTIELYGLKECGTKLWASVDDLAQLDLEKFPRRDEYISKVFPPERPRAVPFPELLNWKDEEPKEPRAGRKRQRESQPKGKPRGKRQKVMELLEKAHPQKEANEEFEIQLPPNSEAMHEDIGVSFYPDVSTADQPWQMGLGSQNTFKTADFSGSHGIDIDSPLLADSSLSSSSSQQGNHHTSSASSSKSPAATQTRPIHTATFPDQAAILQASAPVLRDSQQKVPGATHPGWLPLSLATQDHQPPPASLRIHRRSLSSNSIPQHLLNSTKFDYNPSKPQGSFPWVDSDPSPMEMMPQHYNPYAHSQSIPARSSTRNAHSHSPSPVMSHRINPRSTAAIPPSSLSTSVSHSSALSSMHQYPRFMGTSAYEHQDLSPGKSPLNSVSRPIANFEFPSSGSETPSHTMHEGRHNISNSLGDSLDTGDVLNNSLGGLHDAWTIQHVASIAPSAAERATGDHGDPLLAWTASPHPSSGRDTNHHTPTVSIAASHADFFQMLDPWQGDHSPTGSILSSQHSTTTGDLGTSGLDQLDYSASSYQLQFAPNTMSTGMSTEDYSRTRLDNVDMSTIHDAPATLTSTPRQSTGLGLGIGATLRRNQTWAPPQPTFTYSHTILTSSNDYPAHSYSQPTSSSVPSGLTHSGPSSQ